MLCYPVCYPTTEKRKFSGDNFINAAANLIVILHIDMAITALDFLALRCKKNIFVVFLMLGRQMAVIVHNLVAACSYPPAAVWNKGDTFTAVRTHKGVSRFTFIGLVIRLRQYFFIHITPAGF
jgi:hypothetical protein